MSAHALGVCQRGWARASPARSSARLSEGRRGANGGPLHAHAPRWRTNWSIQYDDVPDLAEGDRRPGCEGLLDRFERDGVGEAAWLRVEIQNVRKITGSGAVLFTIRTYIEPLAGCREEGATAAANLAVNIRALSPAMMSYKGLDEGSVREAVLRFFDGNSGAQIT